ncbi:autotransporter domain-containing protein [Rickettsia conorii subsp. heilongjiangensis]|uniref:Autotransporter domain-containing protein n=1 Tax=Rickettsia conorii subsp. heilongjiangensis TaxID=226665 RepID=A0AAD1LS09_RICCR|nr:autotransporter outer membrane beta-barrel domain-containing protein [Rickettsia conorii]AEK74057.1 cell surface antigen [Rickettsia conorii subsp. heilongjiangensis 054]BBM90856.1 autotransporter domain-containing protein [Rickettsia conorii subsp. heilongjiangensis]BBM92065.1 autotransporter domain-containing protein [Rickettsia conorii subsp. heilongjiangensis]BBM93274.1 autotransporter domain-containing protein [Rickettsia conorii subsp. heilongjiangensis]BBM94483.1 autotransporter doma
MNKLTEQHLLKKSRFLKYSLFASISVGTIIAIPFEGMAMSKEAFRIDLSNKLLNHVSQLNGHKDTTNTPQQIGTVIVPEPEINTYTPSEIREMKISNKPKASNPLKDVPIEDHYKVVARSKSDVGKARKVRPITRRKTFAGTEKTAQSQSTYTPESIEQMPQKSEIIITESSPTFSPDSNGFVTAPNTPNTTLTSPEHYTTAPGTPSSTPATPYQPTSDSKPNDSLGANTPPNINTNSKAARRLSFSSSNPQQQAVQSSSQVKPEVPLKPTFVPLPTKKSSTEIAAGMVSNISRINEIIGIKLAEVTQAIKDTTGKKNKKPLQKLYKQLTSAQKITEELKSRAEEIETKIKIGKNKDKIKKLEKELTSKNNKADRLFQKIEKIDIPANKVSIKSQETVPVTTASTKVSAFQAQQARINEARQGVFNKNKSSGDNARKSSARTEREKKKQEAQKQLSEIKKQEKAIKTASDKAKEVAASVKKETSRTALRAMQDKMNGDFDGPTYKQPPKAMPTIPLSHGVQRILCEQPEDVEGYLVPRKVQQQPYTVMLPNQEIEDPIPSHSQDIYESKVSQYINYLNSIQPNQLNQAQIDSVIDSLATEMRKFSADQFSQKLGEIAHLASIKAYEDLFEKLYEIQQARIPKTQKVYEQEEIFQSYAEYEENLRKSSTPVLSRSSSAKSVISSNFEEKSALLQTTTTDESLRSDNNWKNSAPYSSSPKLDKRGLEYLDLAGDAFVQNLKQPDTLTIEALSLITPTQNTTVAKSDSSRKNNVSGSIPEIQQLQSEKMRTETLGVQDDLELYLHYTPQETLTEESTYLVSSKNKQGNIIKRAVSKVGSILQTNYAENRKRKRDGETSKQRTVDQEGEFGHAWGNENHNVVSGFTKKATQLISLLDAKRTAILQTTSPSQRKSLSLVLQEIENDYREAIKISQELQQVLIRKPEDIKAYNSKAEKKLDAIKSRADKYFNNIETDADVGFNPNGGNSHSMPPANMDSLPKNLAVTPTINVGSLYNSPQAQQFREDHKNIIINDRSQGRLNLVDSTMVRELTDVDASIYNTAPPEVVKEAEALLDRSQGRLNLVDSTIKKGTQPLSNLSTIYESVSYENLASETIYKTEQPKPSISYTNTSKRELPIPLFRSADLDKKLEYLDLEDKLLEVEEARIVKEKQAIATLDQYQDPENPEFKRLAMEALDLSSKESQLKAKRKTIAAEFSLNEKSSSTDVSILRSYSIDDISSVISDAESNLSRSPSVSGLEDLNNSNVMKLGELKSKHKKIANDYKAKELELDTLNHDDPEKIWLEGEIKHLDTESKPKVTESKPVFSCSSSVGSINSFSNGDDLSSRDVVTSVDTLTREIDKDYVDTYIRVLSNKIQGIEELPGSSSRSEELNHIKEAMAYISNRIQDVEELDEKMLLAINARLQEHDEKISSLLLEKYTGEEAADILAQSLLQEMLVSDGKSESILPAGDEEQEDTEVNRQLSSLPALASSNECALALSDDREKECLALGDGSEDEESYDSGFEEEEETIGQLSDSDGGNLKITEVDTAIPLEQEAKKEMQTQISENAPTLNQAKVVNTIVNNMIRNRLDASMNMSNNMVAVGAGDEEESHIKRGLWMRGMYGTNNHGRVENMTGYRGTNKGATIGFDAEIDNNIVGIAYSNVHSVFKFKNSKNNDKELINSHVVSIYGQKELPKNFALQALVSASKNFIKDKTTYSYGDTKIRSNVKHRNNSYNAEALLHYNYLLQSKFVITPNIGLRYGKSRDGVYNEIGVNVQEIALTMKENNILSGIVGTKVTVPLKDALKFNNLSLAFQGAVEHNFKEKTQRINRVVKIFDNTFKHNYLIPKQPKTSYNLGTGIIGSIKNTTISLDYNYYLNKHYRSHQGSVKLKVNL